MRRRLDTPLEPPVRLGVGPSITGRELIDDEGGRPTIWVSVRRRDGSADPEARPSAARDRGGAAAAGFGKRPREGSSHHTQGARNSECISIKRSAGILVIPNREVAGGTHVPQEMDTSSSTPSTQQTATEHGNGRVLGGGLPSPRSMDGGEEGASESTVATSGRCITAHEAEGTVPEDGEPSGGQDPGRRIWDGDDERGHSRPRYRPDQGHGRGVTSSGRSLRKDPFGGDATSADAATSRDQHHRHSRGSNAAADKGGAGAAAAAAQEQESTDVYEDRTVDEGVSPGFAQQRRDTAPATATSPSQQCQQQRPRPHRGVPVGTDGPGGSGISPWSNSDVGLAHVSPVNRYRKRGRACESVSDSPTPPARRPARPAAPRGAAAVGRRGNLDDCRGAPLPAGATIGAGGATGVGPRCVDGGASREEEEARQRPHCRGPSGAVAIRHDPYETSVPNQNRRPTDSHRGNVQGAEGHWGAAEQQTHLEIAASSGEARRRLRGKQRPGEGHCQMPQEESRTPQATAAGPSLYQLHAQGVWPAGNSVHDSGYAGPSRSSHLHEVDRFPCRRDRDGQASVGAAAVPADARRAGGHGSVAAARMDHAARGGRPPDAAASGDDHPSLLG